MDYIWVAIGGAVGSIARYAASGLIANSLGQSFPLGTLFVNVTGSFLIGFFASITSTEGRWLVGSTGRIFFMTGVCGGYTTFSSFSLQTLNLLQEDEWLYAGANTVLNLILCLVAVWAGYVLASSLTVQKGD